MVWFVKPNSRLKIGMCKDLRLLILALVVVMNHLRIEINKCKLHFTKKSNMINRQKEIWISTNNSRNKNTVIAISNCGRIMRKNGNIEFSYYKQQIRICGKLIFVYQFIANHFILKTENDLLKQRIYIDHITHLPVNMNINDVRNLRWCTNKENHNFKEARLNKRKPKSEFGLKYNEHYGYGCTENKNQYAKERMWFMKYGKCRWE